MPGYAFTLDCYAEGDMVQADFAGFHTAVKALKVLRRDLQELDDPTHQDAVTNLPTLIDVRFSHSDRAGHLASVAFLDSCSAASLPVSGSACLGRLYTGYDPVMVLDTTKYESVITSSSVLLSITRMT
jgi:hypothetical protein